MGIFRKKYQYTVVADHQTAKGVAELLKRYAVGNTLTAWHVGDIVTLTMQTRERSELLHAAVYSVFGNMFNVYSCGQFIAVKSR